MFAWFRFVLVSFEDGSMQIFVKTMTFGTVGIKVYACDTINDIKRALGRKIDQIFEGYDVEMPILSFVFDVLYSNKSPKKEIVSLSKKMV